MNQVRKKILFVVTKSNWGGAQKYVYDLATGLPKDRFDPCVAFGGTGEPGEPAGELATKLEAAGVRRIFVPAFARDVRLFGDIRALFELLRIFRKERPDVVHLNSSKAGGLGALAARLSGVREIVFTVHGLPENEARSASAQRWIRRMTRLTFKLCTAIVVISKQDMERIGSAKAKAHLIYNGAWPTELLSRQDARAAIVPGDVAARRESDIWLLTNAELHPNKNLFVAIETVSRYNETHARKLFYVMIGEGESRRKIEDDLKRRGLREQVFLAGFVKNAARYARAFDIFFLPSKKEGLPYALLEAGLAELPIVASNVGGIPELIDNGENGFLLQPDDVEGFESAIAKLGDGELRARFTYALLWKIKRDFSFEQMLQKTIALY